MTVGCLSGRHRATIGERFHDVSGAADGVFRRLGGAPLHDSSATAAGGPEFAMRIEIARELFGGLRSLMRCGLWNGT